MSTATASEHNQLITCHLCQRRYNADVYKRHIDESQCVKRNQHRLPFESIKQRSIQIGDKIFSVQQQAQQKAKEPSVSNNHAVEKPPVLGKFKQAQEKPAKLVPSHDRRRTLEQAKQLLERRTKYKPPWIHKRSESTSHPASQLTRTNTITLSPRELRNRTVPSDPKSPPTTRFKNDDVPIRISDRRTLNHPVAKQPVLTHSPKIPNSKTTTHVSQRAEQPSSPSRSTRKASTWTRPLPPSAARKVISPIQIPTFQNSADGPSHDRTSLPFNSNYDDDDDEFERYSPTPPSTPRFQRERAETKAAPANAKQPSTTTRPVTYQRGKRAEPPRENAVLPVAHFNHSPRKPAAFHLPPIKPASYAKLNRLPTINLIPWR